MEMQERLSFASKVFTEHEPAIRALIRRHADNREEEEEIYQNLYLSLLCNPAPSPLTNTVAYLSTVIRNDVIDAARRRKSYQEMISRYAAARTYDERENNPAEAVIQEEEVQRITAFVQSALPAHEARAVIERYEHGCSTTDAAAHMRVKERTVSRYLCIGLKRIREAIAGWDVEESVCP